MSLTAAARVMVVGGAGYIGTELVRALALRPDVKLAVVDLGWFGNYLPQSIDSREADAWTLTRNDLEGIDAVLLLAGLANDEMCELSPGRNFRDNGALPAYLGHLCKQASVKRFVFASSCSVYGDVLGASASESDEPRTTHPYGLAKLQAEAALMRMADQNFSVYCVRKGTVSGWSPRMRLDLILNAMTRDALTRQRIFVRGPDLWRPILSVGDAVAVYTSLLLQEAKAGIPSGAYNVAEGNYTVHQLAQVIEDVFRENGRPVTINIEQARNPRTCRIDLSKCRRLLPYAPRDTPTDIARTLYSRMTQVDLRAFADERFYNIQVFRRLLATNDGSPAI